VTTAAVRARAQELEAELARARDLLTGWTPPELERQAATMGEIIEDADRDVRREKRRAKLIEGNTGINPVALGEAPGWTRDRSKLEALGFRVEPFGEAFVVKRRPPSSERGKKAATLSPPMKTAPMAWDFAARLCGL
jgi:hypothetical protein